MLLTDAPTIRDILLFPTMKPVGQQKKEKTQEAPAQFECACFTCPSQEACKAAQEAERTAQAIEDAPTVSSEQPD